MAAQRRPSEKLQLPPRSGSSARSKAENKHGIVARLAQPATQVQDAGFGDCPRVGSTAHAQLCRHVQKWQCINTM
jgi:hypothetical protein